MLIYTAGPLRPFTDDDGVEHALEENIRTAAEHALRLWEQGHAVICPHTNSNLGPTDPRTGGISGVDGRVFLDGDLRMLARCDALYLLPRWPASRFAVCERAYASRLGMPIFVAPEIPPLHRTEQTSPIQVRAFAEELGRMMRMHLAKNADYGSANVLGLGEVGVGVRLWDKTVRLMSLLGFCLRVEAGSFEVPRTPLNEAIEDSYRDLSVYGVIGLLLRQGKWGR